MFFQEWRTLHDETTPVSQSFLTEKYLKKEVRPSRNKWKVGRGNGGDLGNPHPTHTPLMATKLSERKWTEEPSISIGR